MSDRITYGEAEYRWQQSLAILRHVLNSGYKPPGVKGRKIRRLLRRRVLLLARIEARRARRFKRFPPVTHDSLLKIWENFCERQAEIVGPSTPWGSPRTNVRMCAREAVDRISDQEVIDQIMNQVVNTYVG